MRLTEEMVIARSKQSNLAAIKRLNLWGSDLTDVSIIKKMLGVEVLALSVNNISSLAPFEGCLKLQELYLRKNNISDFNELAYLQNLPNLKHLWLEENPCQVSAGPEYRSIVLRMLPNLKKVDDKDVTQEELDQAMRAESTDSNNGRNAVEETGRYAGSESPNPGDNLQDDAYEQQAQYQHSGPAQHQQQQQQQQQHYYSQHSPPPQSQMSQSQRRAFSPTKEQPKLQQTPVNLPQSLPQQQPVLQQSQSQPSTARKLNSFDSIEECTTANENPSEALNSQSISKPESPPTQRSPISDQESSQGNVYAIATERTAMPSSFSAQSMKEYYQSERPMPHPAHYRHSQNDLTEWEEQAQHTAPPMNPYGSTMSINSYAALRRSSAGGSRLAVNDGGEREDRFAYRNGTAGSASGNIRENGNGDWDDAERPFRARRSDVRLTDPANLSPHLLHHYTTNMHRRPVTRNSNLLSAALCLVKELDYNSLAVVEHAVRSRIEELNVD